MRNAALLGLMQPNLKTGSRRTGRYALFGLASGNFREIVCFVWNLLAFAPRVSVGTLHDGKKVDQTAFKPAVGHRVAMN